MHLSRMLLTALATLLSLGASVGAFPLGAVSSASTTRSLRAAATAAMSFNEAAAANKNDDHAYFRPAAQDVSGFPKNDKPYHRSPCPCLNSLANHGYLARDGKNLTPVILKQAIMDVFHVGESLAGAIVGPLPETLTLADLGAHNFIEHDASMVHDDAYFGQDPSHVNVMLVTQLLVRANRDGILTKKEVARWRHEREIKCTKTNPQYDFSFTRQGSAYAEAAAFLIVMGDYDSESISVADAASFLVHERIPDGFVRSETEISLAHALYVAAKLKTRSSFPWELLSAYGRWLRSVADREWDAAFPLSVGI